MRLIANPSSAGWEYIDGRRDVPGVVAMVRETGSSKPLNAETTAEVAEWIEREGWEPDEAPVLLD